MSVLLLSLVAQAWESPTRSRKASRSNWSDGGRAVVSDETASDPSPTSRLIQSVLVDDDSRISEEFRVPPEMRQKVSFWLKIYTLYSSRDIVVFDDEHLERVYEVVDLRDLEARSRNAAAFEILSRGRMQKILRGYREAFARLRRNPRPRKPGVYERKILAAIARSGHPADFKKLGRDLRTQTGQREHIMSGLAQGAAYFPKLEQIFESIGVPKELTRLPLVESSFNLSAISRVGAVGVWQFMPDSAREFMLVSEHHGIDERLSPFKAAVGAAKLLKRNHGMLADWGLTVTSYNQGASGLLKARRRIGEELFASCENPARLGWVGRNFFAEFLAVLHADAYSKEFYGKLARQEPKDIQFYRLKGAQTPAAIAKARGFSLQDFRSFNPDVRNLWKPLPKGFVVAVPGESDTVEPLLLTSRRNPRRS